MKKKISFLYEPKSNIGWVHGLLSCICALICAYLTMMISSYFLQGDYAYRIIPSILLTPILMTVYGLWFLFVSNMMSFIKRVLGTVFILSFILILALKVF